jgi:hypothetical protein
MMTLNRISLIAMVAAFAIGCGSDDDDTRGGTGGSGNTSSGGSGNSGTGGGSGGGTATGGAGGGTAVVGATCAVEGTPGCWQDLMGFPGIMGAYAFGDGTTTMELSSPSAGTVCMAGTMAAQCATGCPDGGEYSLWGGGIGMQLATAEAGVITEPFDATALGIEKVRFSITTPPASGLRVQISLTADNTLGFVYGGGTADITAAVTDEVAPFTAFTQPAWGDETFMWDPTDIDAIQFQVVSVVGTATPYNFCVSNLAFLDANDAVVDVPVPGAGGAGG